MSADKTWVEAETVSRIQPPAREETISSTTIYLRKNFEFHPAHKENGEQVPDKWTYMECMIPKEVAELLRMTDDNTESIASVEDALCELSRGGV